MKQTYITLKELDREIRNMTGLREVNIETIRALKPLEQQEVRMIYSEWRERQRAMDKKCLKRQESKIYQFKNKEILKEKRRVKYQNGKTKGLEYDVEERKDWLHLGDRRFKRTIIPTKTNLIHRAKERRDKSFFCEACKSRLVRTRNAKRLWCKNCNIFSGIEK